MIKRFIVLLLGISAAGDLYAQFSKEDSLKVQSNRAVEEELRVNPAVRDRIDFGGMAEPMRMSENKSWLQPDETLPKVAYTEVDGIGTDSLHTHAYSLRSEPTTKVGTTLKLPPLEGISLGNGVRILGNTIYGLNLMRVFEKNTWCEKQRERRERTLSVLRYY